MSKGEETKQAILEHASRLASRIGLEALSIGALATDLDLSKSGLFAHFGSKESLQIAVLEFTAASFTDLVVKQSFKAPAGEPRIRQLFENWLIWAKTMQHDGGCLFVQASTEFDDQPGPVRDFLQKIQHVWLTGLAESARRAMAVGHFRPDLDAEQFAFEYYAMLLGFHNSHRLLHDPRAEARVRAAIENLLGRCRSTDPETGITV